MVKLTNAAGQCQWIMGTTGMEYFGAAKKMTGKKRYCKTVKNAIEGFALQSLKTAILCGYDTLLSVESNDRKDIIVNIKLPVSISDAVNKVIDTHTHYAPNGYCLF